MNISEANAVAQLLRQVEALLDELAPATIGYELEAVVPEATRRLTDRAGYPALVLWRRMRKALGAGPTLAELPRLLGNLPGEEP